MFDVLVKRIHEYKRQLLLGLYMIHRYTQLKRMNFEERSTVQPKVFIIAGKAMPSYIAAKQVIKLINCIADVVNNDPDMGDLMKVIFIENYSVSIAEIIIPGTDLSEQISTAGTEASGTSNMKFVMNGAVIIGTMDGANVEIAKEIGEENMFIFGARLNEVPEIRNKIAIGEYKIDTRIIEIFSLIKEGHFGNPKEMISLIESIEHNDIYLLCHDFNSYVNAHEKSEETFKDKNRWIRMSIWGALNMGLFSSDRSIEEYCQKVWEIEEVIVPTPSESPLTRIKSQPHSLDANQYLDQRREIKVKKEEIMINKIEDSRLGETLNQEETIDRKPTTF